MRNKKRPGYKRQLPNIKVPSPDRVTLSPRESTKITGFGLVKTYDLLKSRRMPSIRVGSRFFIPKTALMRWLENCGGTGKTAA
jgi:excisionase family DNA binding protein